MRLIFLVVALFMSLSVLSQTPSVITRTNGTNTVNDPRLTSTLNFVPPRYVDTTAANTNLGVDSCGALIFTYSTNNYWVRACNPKRWSLVGEILTANNGMTKTNSNLSLGGNFTGQIDINGSVEADTLTIRGSTSTSGNPLFYVHNSGNGRAIKGYSPSGYGVVGESTTGSGLYGTSSSSVGVFGASGSSIAIQGSSGSGTAIFGSSNIGKGFDLGQVNNFQSIADIVTIGSFRKYASGSVTPAAGYGMAIDFDMSTSTTPRQAGRIIYRWTDATDATRTSSFDIHTVGNGVSGRSLGIGGDGRITADKYTSLTAGFDSTNLKPVAMDGSGNIYRFNRWVGGGVTGIDLGYTPASNQGTVTNSTGGNNAILPVVTTTNAGLMSPGMLNIISASSYIMNGLTGVSGRNDSLIWFANDSTYVIKQVNLIAGSGVTIDKNHTDSSLNFTINASGGGGGGSVESVAFTDGNGFDGSVATATTTPTITLTTTLSTNSVPFIASGGGLSQDNSNLSWNNSTKVLTVPSILASSSNDLNLTGSTGNDVFINSGLTNLMWLKSSGAIDIGTVASPFGTIKLNVGGNVQSSDAYVLSDGTTNAEFGITGSYSFLKSASNHGLEFATNDLRRAFISNAGAITFNTSSNSYTFPSARASAGQVLTDVSGNGTLTWETPSGGGGGGGMSIGGDVTGGTSGSMLWVNSSGDLAQDNTNLNWNNTTKVLTVPAVTAPSSTDLTFTALNPHKISFVTNGNERLAINNGGSIVFNNSGNEITFPTFKPGYAGSALVAGTNGNLAWTILTRGTTSTTSASSLTPDIDETDNFAFTALAANLTINAPTSDLTISDFRSITMRIKDNGTSRTLTWNAAYHAGSNFALPAATVSGVTFYIQFVYNASTSQWDAVGMSDGF